MSNLIQDDIARCAGRLGLDLDAPICLRREKCARYLQMFQDLERHANGLPMRLSYYTGLCRDGSDHLIPVNDESDRDSFPTPPSKHCECERS